MMKITNIATAIKDPILPFISQFSLRIVLYDFLLIKGHLIKAPKGAKIIRTTITPIILIENIIS